MDLDEVAHYEPPYQDLRCLQIQLFASLVVKEFRICSLRDMCKYYIEQGPYL